ncbi:MAG: acetyl-CoA carboxylase carboxyltransferase subunit [Archangium gephyra]|uniref:Acetyl-CoA carboxylase carboxyltransferase subunit n=1 Tax=Archangium gephyra TaxID=48 RepID=A0A2W5SY32_9BACT|nr:MAG: acetyl-CoA carboxylase carboxyltransferase subunit [Archangium gephyra]
MRINEQQYPVLSSHAELRGPSWDANREQNLKLLEPVNAALAKSREGGGARYNDRHRARGKLLPRERVELLLDRDSHFLELCPLAGNEIDGHAPGASVIGGIGRVSGVECVISANESTVKGGSMSEYSVVKSHRLAEVASSNRLPLISLTESGGADLPNQDKIFVPGGKGFRDLTRKSEQRLPTVTVVFGSSTAGGAYIPGMSDYSIFVKKQATVYLGGPPLVKMATGEETDDESLGGAEMHSRISGVSDYLAEDERDAIRLAREVVAHLDWRKHGHALPRVVEPPKFDAEELLGVVSPDPRVPFDPREVIARIVDGSRFSEFKPLYGNTLVCGWAHLHGYPVGILANHGILFSESANKGAQFIQLCNQANVPLLFLQNITGFMVGRGYEEGGIIKNGAKLINAVSNSTVPAITIMMGASYGAGNYAMSGRAYEPRFLFTWPSHRIAVMGGKQAAGVLEIIQRNAAQKRNEPVDEETLGGMKQLVEYQIDQQSSALYATARLWDDGIIDPRDTRTVVALSLSAAYSRHVEGTTSWGVFRH